MLKSSNQGSGSRKMRLHGSYLASSLLGLGLCSCSVAQVDVAVVAVHPWEDMVTPLSPKFKLDAEAALSLVNPISQRAKVSTQAGYVSSASGSITYAEGVMPSPEETSLEDAPRMPIEHIEGALASDPFLTYASATALFQEVELLERYLRSAVMRKGYVPYFVRMQVAVEPYHRRATWDAYVDIEFEVADNTANTKDIEVVPLISWLNMENSERSVATSYLLSLTRAVEALGPMVGVDAKGRRRLEHLEARLGRDLNGVSLISRSGEGKLSVRLGARNNSRAKQRQAAQSYSVSALILVPLEDATSPEVLSAGEKEPDLVKEMTIRASSKLRRGSTGLPLAATQQPEATTMTVALPPFSQAIHPQCTLRSKWDQENLDCEENSRSDGDKTTCLAGIESPKVDEDEPWQCWLTEPLTMVDDGKKLSATVPGIRYANAAEMTAMVAIWEKSKPTTADDSDADGSKSPAQLTNPAPAYVELRATSVAVDGDRHLTTFTFPSLRGLEVCDPKCREIGSSQYALYVYHGGADWWVDANQRTFPLLLDNVSVVGLKPKPKPVYAPVLRASSTVIRRDRDGHGTLTLQFLDPRKKGTEPMPDLVAVELEIVGAELEQLPEGLKKQNDGRLIVKFGKNEDKEYVLSPIELSLVNLDDDDNVIVRTRKLEKTPSKRGDVQVELEFDVVPPDLPPRK